ncbi:hypothetical protein [uncultured Halomonas sp.]|uniref:hypothetical protein n=1 Tax=uncultured Halomonas sp. TaxID=173971 RepID=UPI0026225293|nr:hypothetical protein [uncultured Halomonas sp.]
MTSTATASAPSGVDRDDLEARVKSMYREVAETPEANFHFEMGRALADIVTEPPLPESVSCNATLWAACIGGASQEDDYRAAIEAAGLAVRTFREHPEYRFLTESARGACEKWGVKSISLLAVKT